VLPPHFSVRLFLGGPRNAAQVTSVKECLPILERGMADGSIMTIIYCRTGSIESEIIHLHINIYGSRSLSSTMYFWNIVYKENIDSPIIPLNC